jgi:hypothetical protein
MSLDQRLRGALRRSASAVDPDVQRALWAVRRRTRRVVIRQRVTSSLLATALLAAVVVVGPDVLDVIRSQRQPPITPATNPSPSALVGSYQADLTGVGGGLGARGLAGPWTLTLNGDGSILWNPPPGSGLSEGLPRDTYQVSGTTVVTNLFASRLCQSSGVGSYSWSQSGGTLRLVAVDDGCQLRQAILTSAPWRTR